MRTAVIAGGTRGIGKALADRLATGWNVISIGSADADLTSVKETRDLIGRLPSRVDALVLSAGRFSPRRIVTADGFEQSFAINVLARHLLADGLRPALERAEQPVILNLCGVGGIPGGHIHWDDPHLTDGYRMFRAIRQGARANDLLGAGFADHYPDTPIRYVLYNPLFVDSGMHRHLDQPARALLGVTAALFAQKTTAAAVPLERLLNDPPTATLTALRKNVPIPLPGADGAARLYALLADMGSETAT
ncbi:hypothetical protein GCM10010112_76610 [Actinoplanes lobatus]|uniref:NAD(P)-dependent dehydrogenase (Short-subunit alcohol dehydrogenase family) n=1 Tax=Actinoplanes lobatus TaxID=113568 RepID=A0A7W7HM31_9ACTN|nr:short-chain dehydrogenase [Actinoplanes lobatus]MBB4752752.1 NAD(P)-dependent dehydrogenase (short-subunit alcohol dehydrogenase family) [Actinoplanes lobatus]GGN90839.1 hypothetical protein GCM10010112_76610 [Actinoplanes lobatus]GIE43911.1 hypothetical protein Alo02nite_68090 [Actinoplanes lobatus]